MSKVKANNYSKALKEFKAIDDVTDSLVESFPSEIPESDKGHYNVVLVTRRHNEQTRKYKVEFTIQQYDQRGFEKLEKGVQVLGYDKAIVLHTPEAGAKPAQNTAAAVKSEAQIREELRQEFEGKYAGYVPTSDDKDNKVGQDAVQKRIISVIDPKFADLSAMTEKKLRAFAEFNDIDVKGAKIKDDLLGKIQEWQSTFANPLQTDLVELSDEELKQFAEDNEIKIDGLEDRDEIISVLRGWQISPENIDAKA